MGGCEASTSRIFIPEEVVDSGTIWLCLSAILKELPKL